MAKKEKVILFLISFLFLSSAFAGKVETELFRFNTPNAWNCNQDEGLFLCTEKAGPKQKQGVIVFLYGPAGPLENMDQFRTRLKAPRSIKNANGMPILSRVMNLENIQINNHGWFRALHYEGELPNFYTYYMATRRGDFQYLMTLTAHKSQWAKYKPIFEQTMSSIRLLNDLGKQALEGPQAQVQTPMDSAETSASPVTAIVGQAKQYLPKNKNSWIIIGAAIAALIMVLVALKV